MPVIGPKRVASFIAPFKVEPGRRVRLTRTLGAEAPPGAAADPIDEEQRAKAGRKRDGRTKHRRGNRS